MSSAGATPTPGSQGWPASTREARSALLSASPAKRDDGVGSSSPPSPRRSRSSSSPRSLPEGTARIGPSLAAAPPPVLRHAASSGRAGSDLALVGGVLGEGGGCCAAAAAEAARARSGALLVASRCACAAESRAGRLVASGRSDVLSADFSFTAAVRKLRWECFKSCWCAAW